MEPDRQAGNPPEAQAELYLKAAELGKDALDDQVSELDSMRGRVVQFLSFVGTATAFLVGTAVQGGVERGFWFGVWGIAGTVGVLGLLWLLRSILTGTAKWYRGKAMDWHYRVDATAYTEWLDEHGSRLTAAAFYRNLVGVYRDQQVKNEIYLKIIRKRYLAFIVLATMELFLWGVLAWQYGAAK